jgi:hypothetical protein
MAKQLRLTSEKLHHVEQAKSHISRMGIWDYMEGGHEYWKEISLRLYRMFDNCTSDGKPYKEPPLTDADACQRIPVMVRGHEKDSWDGPFTFIRKHDVAGRFTYIVEDCSLTIMRHEFARRLTPDEQAAWEAAK